MNKAIKSVRKRVISDMLTGPLPGSDPDSKRANKRINSLKSKISKADEALAAIDSILCTTYPEKCLLDALEKDERKLLEKTPKITGIVTIKNICKATLNNDCPSLSPPKPKIDREVIKIIGTVITQRILFMAVSEIDKAILPFA